MIAGRGRVIAGHLAGRPSRHSLPVCARQSKAVQSGKPFNFSMNLFRSCCDQRFSMNQLRRRIPMLKARSSLLIAGGSLIAVLAVISQDAAAGPQLPMSVPSSLLHNAQIKNCQYRHPDGTICKVHGDWPFTDHIDKDCRCVHTRVIQGGGGTPGTVEVRRPRNTISGGGHSRHRRGPAPRLVMLRHLVGRCYSQKGARRSERPCLIISASPSRPSRLASG